KQAIARLCSQAAARGRSDFKVASLGCGPAQEVANYLKTPNIPLPVEFTLIDQDHDALSYAYNSTYPEVVRLDGKAWVRCLHATSLEFLATGLELEEERVQAADPRLANQPHRARDRQSRSVS